MSTIIQKFIGWTLLFVGILIIAWSLYSTYNIFTAKDTPPEIFKTKEIVYQKDGNQGLEFQVEEIIEEQLRGMIPADTLPTLLNLIAWSIFAGVMFFGGAQIAGTGAKLIKQ